MEFKRYQNLNELNRENMTQYRNRKHLEQDYKVFPHEGVRGAFWLMPKPVRYTRELVYELLFAKATQAKILDKEYTIDKHFIVFDVYGYINSARFEDDYLSLGDDELYTTIWYEDIVGIQTIVQTSYDALELTISHGKDGRNEFHCNLDRRV